jgi:hypothetical protein
LFWILVAVGLAAAGSAQAQDPAVNELKMKIFEAKMLQRSFAGGLTHCKELDGSNFYFEPRKRVLNLEDYHRSLQNLVKGEVFNPDKRRPWNQKDAQERWEQVQKIAQQDKAKCELVSNLAAMQKQVEELEKKRP